MLDICDLQIEQLHVGLTVHAPRVVGFEFVNFTCNREPTRVFTVTVNIILNACGLSHGGMDCLRQSDRHFAC